MPLVPYLEPGDGVLDIGANLGVYAERFAKAVGPSGYVLAIEPDPDTVMAGQERRAAYRQIHWVTAAVGTGAHRTLYRDEGDHRRNSLWPENRMRGGEAVPCDVISLDDAADMVPNLRAIKIDAQGAEADIVASGPRTLARTNLLWYVELWRYGLSNAGSSLDAVISVFEARGWVPVTRDWAEIRRGTARHMGHRSTDVLIQHISQRREAA